MAVNHQSNTYYWLLLYYYSSLLHSLFSALEQTHCAHVTCDSEWVTVTFCNLYNNGVFWNRILGFKFLFRSVLPVGKSMICLILLCLFLFCLLLILYNSGRFAWVGLQQWQEQPYPFLPVCAIFLCVVGAMVTLPVLQFLTCVQMLMRAIIHRGTVWTL